MLQEDFVNLKIGKPEGLTHRGRRQMTADAVKKLERRTATDVDRELEQLSGELFLTVAPQKAVRERYERLLSSRIEGLAKVQSTSVLLRRRKRWEFAEE